MYPRKKNATRFFERRSTLRVNTKARGIRIAAGRPKGTVLPSMIAAK